MSTCAGSPLPTRPATYFTSGRVREDQAIADRLVLGARVLEPELLGVLGHGLREYGAAPRTPHPGRRAARKAETISDANQRAITAAGSGDDPLFRAGCGPRDAGQREREKREDAQRTSLRRSPHAPTLVVPCSASRRPDPSCSRSWRRVPTGGRVQTLARRRIKWAFDPPGWRSSIGCGTAVSRTGGCRFGPASSVVLAFLCRFSLGSRQRHLCSRGWLGRIGGWQCRGVSPEHQLVRLSRPEAGGARCSGRVSARWRCLP